MRLIFVIKIFNIPLTVLMIKNDQVGKCVSGIESYFSWNYYISAVFVQPIISAEHVSTCPKTKSTDHQSLENTMDLNYFTASVPSHNNGTDHMVLGQSGLKYFPHHWRRGHVSLKWHDAATSLSTNGSTAFSWKLCCHWLKCWCQHDVVYIN